MDALSYVLIAGYGDTSKQGVMKVASFFYFIGKVRNMNIKKFENNEKIKKRGKKDEKGYV